MVQSVWRMFSLTSRLGVAFPVWVFITFEMSVFGYPFDERTGLTCLLFRFPIFGKGKAKGSDLIFCSGNTDFFCNLREFRTLFNTNVRAKKFQLWYLKTESFRVEFLTSLQNGSEAWSVGFPDARKSYQILCAYPKTKTEKSNSLFS